MEITLFQAVLITLFAVFSNLMFPLLGDIGGYFGIGRPMVAGTIVGIILGDPVTGMLIGASLNAVYMNSQAVGNVMSTDVTLAGYTATTLAMAGSNDTAVALALSIPIGLLGAMIFTVYNGVNVFVTHKCDQYAAQGNLKMMWNVGIWAPLIVFNVIRFATVFLVVYYGSQFTPMIEAMMPAQLTAAMGTVGGMLPAVGMALLLKVMITKKNHFCFFLFGFVAYSVLGISSVPLTIFAICISVVIDEVKQHNSSDSSDVQQLESLE